MPETVFPVPLSTTHLVALSAEAMAVKSEQWVQLLPVGKVIGRDGRGPWLVRKPERIVAATRQLAGKGWLAVDYEHQIDLHAQTGKPAIAAGWIKAVEVRADGIWGLIEWTERASSLIRAHEYRYLSPVFEHTRSGEVTRILRAGLTNSPNIDLKALASMGAGMNQTSPTNRLTTELRALLSLPEDAEEDAIIEAVRALLSSRNAVGNDPSAFVPIADFIKVTAELNQVKQGVSRNSAVTHVDTQIERGRLPPYLREWGVSLCTMNKPAFDDFVDRTAPSMQRLFERQGHAATAITGDRALPPGGDDEKAVCAALGLTTEDLTNARRRR